PLQGNVYVSFHGGCLNYTATHKSVSETKVFSPATRWQVSVGEKSRMLQHHDSNHKRQKVPYFLFGNLAQSRFHRGFCTIIHLLTRRPLHRGEKVSDATGASAPFR